MTLPGRSQERRSLGFCRAVALVAGGLLLAVGSFGQPRDGVTIRALTPWLEESVSHGYAEIPVLVENASDETRTVRLDLAGDQQSWDTIRLDSLSRTVEVPAKGAAVVRLLHPPAPLRNPRIGASVDGRPPGRRTVSVVDSYEASGWGYYTGAGRPCVIVLGRWIAPDIRARVEENIAASSTSSSSVRREFRHATVPVDAVWPETWLGYTRAAVVVLSAEDWRNAGTRAQAAMRRWVFAGGAVMFSDADPRDLFDESLGGGPVADIGGAIANGTPTGTVPLGSGFVGGMVVEADAAFRAYGLGSVGRVGGAWPRYAADLRELMSKWGDRSPVFRDGLSRGEGEKQLGLLEGVTLPGRSLLVMLTLFAVGVGPVSLLVLRKYRRRTLLFVTAPLAAGVFSVTVFAYGLLSDGIRPRAMSRSVWLLDQGSREAVGLSHRAVYAPLSPRGGIRFGSSTGVALPSPDFSFGFAFRGEQSLRLSLDGGQVFSSGLVQPRVATHLQTVSALERRERLTFSVGDGGVVAVSNGLGLRIERAVLDTPVGLVSVEGLEAGGSGGATPVEGEALDWDVVRGRVTASSSFATTMKTVGDFSSPPRGGYVAVLEGDGFLELGVENLRSHDARTVVCGFFGGAEGGR
ncbi:MAG: hypothetical protein AAF108_06505 [Planctomycetota bacterium]